MPTVAAAPIETLTVSTQKATYQFSSLGAAPISARLNDFRSLGNGKKDTARVELVRPGEDLFSYRLVANGDTIAFDKVPFTATRRTDGTTEVVSFTGTAKGATLGLTYRVATDAAKSYRTQVQATVSGVTGTPYLLISLPRGFRSTEADPAEDATHLAYAYRRRASDAKSIAFAKLKDDEKKLEPGPHTWVAAKNKYFVAGVLTPTDQETSFAEVSFGSLPTSGKTITAATATIVAELKGGTLGFELYVGPQEFNRLVAMGRDFDHVNPYGGWLQGVVQPFAAIVVRVLLWMKQATQLNYGWVLIIFGLAIRLAMWPLNQSAMRSSMRMQRIQPELQKIQQQYGKDPQKMQAELTKVYAAHGLSPFSAFSGCLPMLLPMPVLFALFWVFGNTIEFRGVSFLWLPDISMKDPLYLLPLFMGVTMYLLSWIGMRNAPENPQAKMMSYIFPVMMTFLFLNFASGLNLYYTIQNLAALPQQWLLSNERAKNAAIAKT
jgi:YidC/Oxa1 family membrane protein insertase